MQDRDSYYQAARQLLSQALTLIEERNEGACWRTADALYYLSKVFPNAQGIVEPTGLGAMLRDTTMLEGRNKQTNLKGIYIP